jgi:hypothetical protein
MNFWGGVPGAALVPRLPRADIFRPFRALGFGSLRSHIDELYYYHPVCARHRARLTLVTWPGCKGLWRRTCKFLSRIIIEMFLGSPAAMG